MPEFLVRNRVRNIVTYRCPIEERRMEAGSSPDCDIPFNEPAAAPVHFAIYWKEGRLHVESLVPRGIDLNGAVVHHGELDDNASILVGEHLLIYNETSLAPGSAYDRATERVVREGREADRRAIARLRIQQGSEVRTVPLVSGDVIGREPPSTILVTGDISISRRHVRIARIGDEFLVRDLVSENGFTVGGARVEVAYLGFDVPFRIGKAELTVVRAEDETEVETFEGLVGSHPKIVRVYQSVVKIAPTDVAVYIHGETGTGKEKVAKAIHARSTRAKGPYVTASCAELTPGTVESELFGHEVGAFTGAVGQHIGLIEQANGGTLFLDEIGDLPLEMQPKLLRVLQEGEVRRKGSKGVIKVDVRVVIATHRDLQTEVDEGRFRSDLRYRLDGYRLELPALRERPSDLPALCKHYLKVLSADGPPLSLSPRAEAAIAASPWPGNVRQLFNVLKVASAFRGGSVIEEEDLKLPSADPAVATSPPVRVDARVDTELVHLPKPLAQVEEEVFRKSALRNGGDPQAMMTELGISRAQVYRLLEKFGLTPKGGKKGPRSR